MNVKRICRALMCLVLICCLIVQTVPVKTEATGAGLAATIASASSVTVAAPLAVGASLIALGVMANNTNPLVFENVVNDAVDSLSAAGQWVADGTVELLRTVDEAGNAMYYAAGEMLEGLRSWLFDEGDVLSTDTNCLSYNGNTYSFSSSASFKFASHPYTISSGVPVSFYSVVLYIESSDGPYYPYCFAVTSPPSDSLKYNLWSSSLTSYPVVSNSSFSIFPIGSWSSHKNLDSYYTDCSGMNDLGVVSGFESSTDFYKHFLGAASLADGISSSLDLSLGQIPTYSLDGTVQDNAFKDYMSKQIRFQNQENPEDPDGDEANYDWMVPLSLGAAGTVYAMTQAEQWLGSTPSDFSDYETVTDYTIVDSTMSNIGTDSNSTTVPFIIVDTTNAGGSTSPSEPSDEGETIPGAGAVTATLLQRLFGGVQEKLDATYISIREIPDLLRDFMLDVKKGFEELPSKFAEWFSNIQTLLELFVSGQLTIGQLLSEFISPLVDAFKALLQSLFSPSPNFIANKVDSLVAKYPHFNVFIGLGTQLKSFFLGLGSTPPIVYIDLGAATGSYFFGGRQAFIDLSWYADYKPTMDAILGAFIWLWLAWRIFLALPGIINGSSGAAGSIIRYSERNLKSQDGRSDK